MEQNRFNEAPEFQEKVVEIKRCAKVVKGGRRFSFAALVAVGDGKGRLGLGTGKANEVSEAVRKATEKAKGSIVKICLKDGTLPHELTCKYGASRVVLRRASPGTGLIAGGTTRAVLEVLGVQDVLSKILGSRNSYNVAYALYNGLQTLRNTKMVSKLRDVSLEEV